MVAYIHHESGNDTPKHILGHRSSRGSMDQVQALILGFQGHIGDLRPLYENCWVFKRKKFTVTQREHVCACVELQQQQQQEQQEEEEMQPQQKRVPQLQATLLPSLACRMPQYHQ